MLELLWEAAYIQGLSSGWIIIFGRSTGGPSATCGSMMGPQTPVWTTVSFAIFVFTSFVAISHTFNWLGVCVLSIVITLDHLYPWFVIIHNVHAFVFWKYFALTMTSLNWLGVCVLLIVITPDHLYPCFVIIHNVHNYYIPDLTLYNFIEFVFSSLLSRFGWLLLALFVNNFET